MRVIDGNDTTVQAEPNAGKEGVINLAPKEKYRNNFPICSVHKLDPHAEIMRLKRDCQHKRTSKLRKFEKRKHWVL